MDQRYKLKWKFCIRRGCSWCFTFCSWWCQCWSYGISRCCSIWSNILLHYCNVDRLCCYWQSCHPDVWIEEDDQTSRTFNYVPREKKIGVDTDLIPFKKSDTEFLNSNDARYSFLINYKYINRLYWRRIVKANTRLLPFKQISVSFFCN